MRRPWILVGPALAMILAAGCSPSAGHSSSPPPSSTSTTVMAAVESTTTTTVPAVVAAPPPLIDVADPASDRASVPGAVVVPAPPVADLCGGSYVKKSTPPTSVTDPLKATQVAHGPFADKDPSHYIEDQLIPVELGGAPTDPRNLWPQTPDMAQVKDREEKRLRASMCHGDITLSAAQTEMLQNWGPLPKS
jgi:hypothetical protein